MTLSVQQKTDIVSRFRRGPEDTGSPEVQVAILTARIQYLTDHFKTHIHDRHSRQGLLRLVSKRRRLLDYLRRVDHRRYRSLIGDLGLRR